MEIVEQAIYERVEKNGKFDGVGKELFVSGFIIHNAMEVIRVVNMTASDGKEYPMAHLLDIDDGSHFEYIHKLPIHVQKTILKNIM